MYLLQRTVHRLRDTEYSGLGRVYGTGVWGTGGYWEGYTGVLPSR